ncbi:MAG TPA: 16S rRNA (cytosine(1402)-N(4))-methyltransferase RsmH [Gemmatimonadaceae bacterium]|nr:16S rRNA (cytosine(1402)-N(4))-methyltransferase RsmH [Gemmatimonadaceae bacterium]
MIASPDSTDAPSFATSYHAPVLVGAVLAACATASTVLDGTLGGGGHTAALLTAGKHVTALDRDPAAIEVASARLEEALSAGMLEIVECNYADVDAVPQLAGRRFDAVLLDLGVSSRQLDDDSRGFSFRVGAPLDMRMEGRGTSAAGWLNSEPEEALVQAFRAYGDEPRAHRLARQIVERRAVRPFAVSDDFVNAIRATLGARSGPSDFARLFQALRIAVNDELAGLERALPALRERLVPGGLFLVMAYHSGEDRLVKHAFRDWSTACTCPPRAPFCQCDGVALGSLHTRKAIVADAGEIALNPRARSAHLRIWQKAA